MSPTENECRLHEKMSGVHQDGNGANESIGCSRRPKQLIDLRNISLRALEATRNRLLFKDVSATNIPNKKKNLLRVDDDGFVCVRFVIEEKDVEMMTRNHCNTKDTVQLCCVKGLNINQQVPLFYPKVAYDEGSGEPAVSMNATYIYVQVRAATTHQGQSENSIDADILRNASQGRINSATMHHGIPKVGSVKIDNVAATLPTRESGSAPMHRAESTWIDTRDRRTKATVIIVLLPRQVKGLAQQRVHHPDRFAKNANIELAISLKLATFCELLEYIQGGSLAWQAIVTGGARVWRLPVESLAIGDARWPIQYLALALECVGWFDGNHGEYDRDLRCNKEALRNHGKDLGDHHPKEGNTLNILGVLHAQQSPHEEALRYFERALSMGRKDHVVGFPLVPSSLGGIALGYSAQGRSDGTSEEALPPYKTVFGNWHSVATSMPSSIATTFSFQDRNEKALALYKQAFSIHRNTLVDQEFPLVAVLNNVAGLLRKQGRFDEALAYYEKALGIIKKKLGDSHPDVARGISNLASVLLLQNRYTEALGHFEDALLIRKAAVGEDLYPGAASTFNNIAIACSLQGDYEKAQKYFHEALSIKKRIFGDRHPETSHVLHSIAEVHCLQGQFEEALRHHEKALSITKEAMGNRHPEVAVALGKIAKICAIQGRTEQALASYEASLMIAREAVGDREFLFVANTLENIAAIQYSQNRYQEALRFYEEALSIRKEVSGGRNVLVADTLNNIAVVFYAQERYKEAMEYLEAALSIEEEVGSDRHTKLANTLDNIAAVHEQEGSYEIAMETFEKSLSIKRETLGDQHPDVAESLDKIAAISYEHGNYEKALKCLQESLSHQREAPRCNGRPALAATLSKIAVVYNAQGCLEEATNFCEEALASIHDARGATQGNTLDTLGVLFASQGRFEEALDCFQRALSLKKEYLDLDKSRGRGQHALPPWRASSRSWRV